MGWCVIEWEHECPSACCIQSKFSKFTICDLNVLQIKYFTHFTSSNSNTNNNLCFCTLINAYTCIFYNRICSQKRIDCPIKSWVSEVTILIINVSSSHSHVTSTCISQESESIHLTQNEGSQKRCFNYLWDWNNTGISNLKCRAITNWSSWRKPAFECLLHEAFGVKSFSWSTHNKSLLKAKTLIIIVKLPYLQNAGQLCMHRQLGSILEIACRTGVSGSEKMGEFGVPVSKFRRNAQTLGSNTNPKPLCFSGTQKNTCFAG